MSFKNMVPVRRFFLLLVLLVVFLSTSSAQKTRKLETEWLAQDLKSIELVSSLLPADNQTLDAITAILGEKSRGEEEDLGFGARRIEFSKPGGYTYLRLKLFTLNGEIRDYTLAVSGNSDSWPQIRSDIIDAWRKNGGPEFKEWDSGLSYRRSIDPEFAAYKKAVALELGEMRVAKVPDELRDDYEYLISPRENSVVGNGACDASGSTPTGKRAIDALMKAHRIDLVENVLRGYNPGGRVYAALALLEMEKQGSPLNDDARSTIEKIRKLEIAIETCLGCLHSQQTARLILESPQQL